MFEDFENDAAAAAQDRKRMRRSMFASGGVLLGLAALGATMAVSTGIVRTRTPEVEVSFDELPMNEEPPPPPPPQAEPPPPRPRTQRAAAAVVQRAPVAPTSIPNEVPSESDIALVDAGETGSIEGTTDGVVGGEEGGVMGAREPVVEPDEEARLAAIALYRHSSIELPRRIGGCERPLYPQEARRRGIADRVVVRVRVRDDGTLAGLEFVQGNALFESSVRDCVMAMRFEPARLGDGTAVAYARTLTFPFRLTNL